ncbi:MAG: hydrogenase 2 operon protein HybA [Chloroflexi bacterium]|nr:hydrogenase 2 operon protein HybA [Chloroflexota bacterium]
MTLSRRDFFKAAGLAIGGALVTSGPVLSKGETDPNEYAAMLYDATICVGCNACTNACRQWNNTTPEPDDRQVYDAPKELSADTWTMIQLYQGENDYSFVKRQCMHCIDPACVSGCPVHALQKSETGAVTYDKDRCIGCRYCMYACPFHIPRFEWDVAHFPVITKCTLCADRLKDGLPTACAERCPTGALIFGKRGDLIVKAEKRISDDPARYVDHVYGKDDAGGTSVMYLSGVDFKNLGLEDLGTRPIPEISEGTADIILPGVLIGGPILLGLIRMTAKRGGWEDTWPL